MENVHLTKFTKNVNNIQALSDRPNTADGLTAQQLKERFDQAGIDIKSFLNDTLISELENLFGKCPTTDDLKKYVLETTLENYIENTDSRLTDSRTCNNQFDNYIDARENLHIKMGTSLPGSGEENDVFLLY